MGIVVDIALPQQQLGVIIGREQQGHSCHLTVGAVPFCQCLVAISLFERGVEVVGSALAMSLETFGRNETVGLVDDFNVAFLVKHEAMGNTIVHHAQEHLHARTDIDGGLVVVLVDSRELQRHHGTET